MFYPGRSAAGPGIEPMPTLAQWDFSPAGGLQVVEAAEHAGHAMVTLLVSESNATRADLASRGISASDVVEGVISKVTQVSDPAGNVITFAEIPAE